MTAPFGPHTTASSAAPFININYHHVMDYEATDSALAKIKSLPSGQNLLNTINYVTTEDKKMMIAVHDDQITATCGYLSKSQIVGYGVNPEIRSEEHQTAVKLLSTMSKNGQGNEGVPVVVTYSPRRNIDIDYEGYPVEGSNPSEAYVGLAHELVHGMHMMNGTSYSSQLDDVWHQGTGQRKEEERAVGIGQFTREPFSENSIRREARLPIRASYFQRDNQPRS